MRIQISSAFTGTLPSNLLTTMIVINASGKVKITGNVSAPRNPRIPVAGITLSAMRMFRKMIVIAPINPTSMPAIAPFSVVPFHQMPVMSIGTNAEAPTENAHVTIIAMSAG